MRSWNLPRAAAGLCLAAALLGTACSRGGDGSGDETSGADRLSVVASFYPLYEAATRVGGERAEVSNLTAPGTEPHDLELNPRQVDLVEEADLLMYLGRGFQPALERLAARKDKGRAIDLLEGVQLVRGEGHTHDHGRGDSHGEEGESEAAEAAPEEDGHGEGGAGEEAEELDPHVWLDPVLMGDLTERIAQALAELDPSGTERYRTNAAAYRRELDALHKEFRQTLVDCQRNVFVTSHAAFGYLARRYGLEQQSIAGLSPEAEPDPARMAEVADLVADLRIPVIFTETLVSPRVAETLARETGARTAVLNPLEGLSDEEVAEGATYVSVMQTNLQALDEALDCVGA